MTSMSTAGPGTSWRKSSYCNTGGQCVEIAAVGTSRLMRDSGDPAGPHLTFSALAWVVFISGIKLGKR